MGTPEERPTPQHQLLVQVGVGRVKFAPPQRVGKEQTQINKYRQRM